MKPLTLKSRETVIQIEPGQEMPKGFVPCTIAEGKLIIKKIANIYHERRINVSNNLGVA